MSNEFKKISFEEFLNWITDHRYTLIGRFVLAAVTTFFVIIPIFPFKNTIVKLSGLLGISFFHLIVSGVGLTFLLVFLFLFQQLKFPKTSHNKAGIYFAFFDIYKTSTSEKFLDKIYKEVEIEISRSDQRKIFNVVFLKQHLAKNVIKNEQRIIGSIREKNKEQRKKNFSFLPDVTNVNYTLFMYGKLKEARVGKEITYKIEPEYFIKHNPIDELISKRLGMDFKKFLLSQKWSFPESKEMEALEIIPDNIRQHVLYAVGISAYLSGLIKIALGLHENLYKMIIPRLKTEPHLNKLKSNLDRIIPLEANILGNYYFSKDDLDNAIKYHEQVISIKPNHYWAHLSLASHYYTKDASGVKYKKNVYHHLNNAEKYSADSSFKLSKAFLMAVWENDIDGAIELYIKTLRSGNIPTEVVKSTIIWIDKQLKVDDRIYLHVFKGLLLLYKADRDKGKEELGRVVIQMKKDSQYKSMANKISKIIKD